VSTTPAAAERTPRPSEALALVAARIVRQYEASWLSAAASHLASPEAPSSERLSRLKARLLPQFEALLEDAMQPGRPPREEDTSDENRLLRELVALVPRDFWQSLRGERRAALIGAQERLREETGMTQAQFCAWLDIPERTFRSWKEKNSEPRAEPERGPDPSSKRKRRGKPTGRFDLEAVAPGTQLMADTSPWTLFGTPLQIVGVQDPGWRKERLWESFAVHTKEDSELVVETVREALEPGMQVVTDQGKPYISQRTVEALDALECEHAPQKEGCPTEKSPKERAFLTVKGALEPIRELTNDFARAVPRLRDPDFARAAGRILLSVFLRVYETAPGGGRHPLAGRDREELDAIAGEQRERARAERRSVRLTLQAIHRSYGFPGSLESFIRAHRDHALEDIQEAERRLRAKVSDPEVSLSDRYFAGILRNVRDENQPRRRHERERRLTRSEERREIRESRAEDRHRERLTREHPDAVLAEGLDLVSAHWFDDEQRLFARGRGLGTYRLHQALRSMASENPYTVRGRAEAAWEAWTAQRSDASAQELEAVRAVFDRLRSEYETDPSSVPLSALLA